MCTLNSWNPAALGCRYFVRSFCTSDGQYGTGWQSNYGTFNNWIGALTEHQTSGALGFRGLGV